ncbi:hypothetical protein RGU12_20520 [Fredinandcohnia sp. QZ13]|uniref:hypothetical protein n=1 Tax=Fredinandcohnia sp. QZ13 TaxID=3073144 RepID=UPI0028531BFB|nr:hypothetical protein [Fredinandcohnia sp. QZ13]MDR4889883.1 hypothetical protein [Fredinandcohnia sp. QZ13]
MEKKWGSILITLVLAVFLAACGSTNEAAKDSDNQSNTSTTNGAETETDDQKEDSEAQESEETKKEDKNKDAEVFRSSSDDEKKSVEPAENVFDSDKVFYYDNDSVEITLTNASFVKEFSTSNADPNDTWASRSTNTDSQIYFHITGTINNDTTDIFHYGHKLAPVKFFLLYDGKHEFESLAATEEENGTKFGGASVDPLTKGNVHIYFQVPTPVSETDKPLILKVLLGEEEFEIPIR